MINHRFGFFVIFLLIFVFSQQYAGAGIKLIALEELRDQTMTLSATGEGIPNEIPGMAKAQIKLMTRRAATVDAYRQLTEQIYAIQVTSDTTVKDFSLESDEINTVVSGTIQGAKIADTKYHEDGTVQVEMTLDIGRELYDRIHPQETD